MAFKKGSPAPAAVDPVLGRMVQAGLINWFQSQFLPAQQTASFRQITIRQEEKPLALSAFYSLFLPCAVSIAVAALALAAEVVADAAWSRWRGSRRHRSRFAYNMHSENLT